MRAASRIEEVKMGKTELDLKSFQRQKEDEESKVSLW